MCLITIKLLAQYANQPSLFIDIDELYPYSVLPPGKTLFTVKYTVLKSL